MNKFQFWTLNGLNLVLVLLLLLHFSSVSRNSRLAQAVAKDQVSINQAQQKAQQTAQQISPVLDRLAKRIAVGSEKDSRLKDILVKYGLHVTVDVDGQKKNFP